MGTNNSVNLNSSGIVAYDGSGTFSNVGTLLEIANGGTAHSGTQASITANAVICGGTTSTSQLQSVSTSPVAGTILTSNGAGALPTFQPGGTSYKVFTIQSNGLNLADATTYYFSNSAAPSTISTNANYQFYMPFNGRIIAVYGSANVQGTLGSSGNSTLSINYNGSSDTTVTSTLALTSADNNFSNSSLSINVFTGDYIQVKILTPTWTTNPTLVYFSITILLT